MSAEPRLNVTTSASRRMPAVGTQADPINAARVLSAIAAVSIAGGAINIAAASTVGRTNAQNMAFFVVIAVLQIGFGAVALVRAPRWWLALGAVVNLVAAVTWVVSRTAGLPAGPESGIKLPVGFPDALATALEVVVFVGAAALVVRGQGQARSAALAPRVTAAAAVVFGVLGLFGVLAQANVIGSMSTGHGSSVTGPATHSGGGGTSGGGTSGGSSGGGNSGGGSSGYTSGGNSGGSNSGYTSGGGY